MTNSIIVSVSELKSIVQDLRRSGSDYVELSISEAEMIDGEQYPSELSFSACKSSDTDTWIDFEPLKAVENNQELQNKSLEAMHMSSNLL